MNRSLGYKCRAAAKGRGRGLRALRSTKGTGRPRKLTPAQERQVFRWVNGKRPDQYGFDFGLWSRQIVQELLLTRFAVKLSLASIGALLARLGLIAAKSLAAHPNLTAAQCHQGTDASRCVGRTHTWKLTFCEK
jgi:transposase